MSHLGKHKILEVKIMGKRRVLLLFRKIRKCGRSVITNFVLCHLYRRNHRKNDIVEYNKVQIINDKIKKEYYEENICFRHSNMFLFSV